MGSWYSLIDVLILLGSAILLGGLCERFRQSSLIGYLLAGTLLGPYCLNLLRNKDATETMAELGVALLLFTIGLEFSLRRLRSFGSIVLGGGAIQVTATVILAALAVLALGAGIGASIAIGAMIALSSTACVLRLLLRRSEIDSIYGRNALGILLFQDLAVVPLVLLVESLGGEMTAGAMALHLGKAVAAAMLLIIVLYLLLNYAVPFLLSKQTAASNREFPILLAIVTAIGSAVAAHSLHLSPALGAFVAGIILAESPFATQIHADVASLRTLFVTIFFSSIGTQGDPGWFLQNAPSVVGVVAAIVVGKTVIVACVVKMFRSTLAHAAATGLCLAQVGEFSFVLAQMAGKSGLLSSDQLQLMVSATIGSLILTPYLVSFAPRVISFVGRHSKHRTLTPTKAADGESAGAETPKAGHVIIVGFGPAGQRVAEALMEHEETVVVVDLNVRSAEIAKGYGLRTLIADATRADVLEYLNAATASVVAITIPDPQATRMLIALLRAMAPDTFIAVRARYHVFRWELVMSGAHVVIDEEEHVGRMLAQEVRKRLAFLNNPAGNSGDMNVSPSIG
ncbi:MAG: cation:proton antiporter [Planctomycetes bacterium]|nr:cation:proton antiporter [Planctomycetota bacterium]